MKTQLNTKSGWQKYFNSALTLLFVFAATVLLFASSLSYESVRGFLDQFSGDGSADPYTVGIHSKLMMISRFFACVMLMFSLVAGLVPLEFWKKMIQRFKLKVRIRNSLRWWKVIFHREGKWVLGLFLFAALLRLPYLNDPIRYDEAHTYLAYAKFPWFVIVSLYNDPNNHVFHSLLVRFSTVILGDAEWVIRLPAFLAGCVLAPLTFSAGRAFAGREAGIAAGLLVAVSSALIEYSVLGRGYTLLCCFVMLNLLLSLRILRGNIGLEWGLLAISSTLGLWTVPVMVYPNLIVWGWLLLSDFRNSNLKTTFGRFLMTWMFWVGMTCVLTLLFYSPIILTSGISSLSGRGFVEPLSILEFLQTLTLELQSRPLLLLRDWPLISCAGLANYLFMGMYQAFKTDWSRTLAAVVAVLAPLLFVIWQRVIPFERVWLFTVPLVSIPIGYGFAIHLRNQTSSRRFVLWGLWIFVMVCLPISNQLLRQSIHNSQETGVCPEAEELVQLLKTEEWFNEDSPVLIVTASPTSAPIVYYATRAGLSQAHFAVPDETTIRSAVVVVSHLNEQNVSQVLTQFHLNENRIVKHFQSWKKMQTVTLYRFE